METQRKIPVLASIISVLVGIGAAGGLLRMFHLLTPRPGFEQLSIVLRVFSAIQETCSLTGAVLLWRMRPAAFRFFLASLVLSIYLWLAALAPSSHSVRNLVGLLIYTVLYAAICAYTWHVTSRWRTARENS